MKKIENATILNKQITEVPTQKTFITYLKSNFPKSKLSWSPSFELPRIGHLDYGRKHPGILLYSLCC